MDQFNGQLLLALACVAVAVAVLVRRFVRMVRNPTGSGCQSGGCSECPAQNETKGNGFVSLDELVETKKR